MEYDDPKKLQDALNEGRLIPTCDSWYPSIGRDHCHRPEVFEECDCWECGMIPKPQRQDKAHWDWENGGLVRLSISIYDTLQFFNPKYYPTEFTPPPYAARVSFCGDDDFGMEKFFGYEEDARWFICHLPSYISKDFLLNQGFSSI
jgi:hypothetical protein